jgi:ABC-type lipoprotein release transport system permease subunit
MLKIAFRNIFRQRRRTLFTALSIFGGVVLASISIGWSDGTYSTMINMFTRNRLGHIQIHYEDYQKRPSIYKTIRDYQDIGKTLDSLEHVDYWTPRLFAGGLVSVRDKSSGAQLTGIQPEQEHRATRFDRKIIKGTSLSEANHEAVLGKGLARVLEAGVGDSVVFISQAADGSIANDIYKVCGIIDSGNQMGDRMSLYLHLQDAQSLMVLPNQVHEMAIIVDDLDQVDPMTETLTTSLQRPHLSVDPWQVFARNFYQAMRADQEGMWIMLLVIMLIVAVGVFNTVLMSVLERTREYGLLKAVGTKPHQIVALVLYEVNFLAVFSIIAGIGVASLINSLLSQQGIALPQAFSYGGIEFKKMYTTVSVNSILLPTITVFLTAAVVGIFPALRAARNDPATSMRTH